MGISLENSFEAPARRAQWRAKPAAQSLPAPQYSETFDGQNLKIRRKHLSR